MVHCFKTPGLLYRGHESFYKGLKCHMLSCPDQEKKKELYFSVFPRKKTVALGLCHFHLLYLASGMQCFINVGRQSGGREGEREGAGEGGIYERLHDPHFLDHMLLEKEFTGEMEIASPFNQWLWSNPPGSALVPSLLHPAQQTRQQKKKNLWALSSKPSQPCPDVTSVQSTTFPCLVFRLPPACPLCLCAFSALVYQWRGRQNVPCRTLWWQPPSPNTYHSE